MRLSTDFQVQGKQTKQQQNHKPNPKETQTNHHKTTTPTLLNIRN